VPPTCRCEEKAVFLHAEAMKKVKITMQTENLRLQDVPATYAVCYVSQCPKAGQCMRYRACQLEDGTMTLRPCVLPTAIADGHECPHFKAVHVVRGAWGFTRPFAEVKRKDDAPLRSEIKKYLGGNGTYYRYHHGERLLLPGQQQDIALMFARRGYGDEIVFDGYRYVFDFD